MFLTVFWRKSTRKLYIKLLIIHFVGFHVTGKRNIWQKLMNRPLDLNFGGLDNDAVSTCKVDNLSYVILDKFYYKGSIHLNSSY